MIHLALLFTLTAVSSALVCTPQLCSKMNTQDPLNCKGSVIKNGGFCGCYDTCAKVEGEMCQAEHMFGVIPAGTCDDGLQCVQDTNAPLSLGKGLCKKVHKVSERFLDGTKTMCQTIRAQRMISFVIWQGMWTPNCDENGQFLPEQCDNQKKCFCVDAHDGHLLTERMLGQVDCNSVRSDVTTTVKPLPTAQVAVAKRVDGNTQTICQTIRAQRMISFVIWEGMWTPNCDENGQFLPEQCDNQKKCFCVDAHDGHLLTERMLGHMDCSSMRSDVTTTVKPLPTAQVAVAKRVDGNTQTICQTIRAQRMISFVIWKGMWTPNCDENGLFLPEQCDNQRKCFCVDAHDGHLLTERMLGQVDCSSVRNDLTTAVKPLPTVQIRKNRSISKCRQMKSKAMTSLVVYPGMWVPQCDMQGLFMQEQCDFDHKCFCVDVNDGQLLTERMLGHPDCSAISAMNTPTV